MALQSPYYKPTIPFIGPISGGLKDGMTVLVTGNVLKSCRRFRVDFQCGNCQMPRSDVAFHFNVRFDQNCIVCNSHEKGCWQQKERKHDMVFRKGHPFEIWFLVNLTSYVVHVDGKKYLKFKHRIPLSRVDNIGISGELYVDSVSFQGPITHPVCCKPICPTPPQIYPVCCKPICPAPSQVHVDGKLHLEFKHKVCLSQVDTIGISGQLNVDSVSFQGPITHPVCCKPICPTPSQPIAYPIGQCFQPQIYSLPYRTTICGGFFPSKSIIVSGSVSPCAHRFHINLKVGNDTAFHLNPRFDQNVIVRNSKFNMCWGSAERHLPCGMPLLRGQPFTICIQCEAHCFKVAVNGHHQFNYNHRIHNLHQINLLEVGGDITLTNIQA
ncbi:galectin-9B-like [Ahaetulla prasina]|uniref:galectin-9B-like n=1 Tax=Ahaetulla prasina TaxID=499056 RepID=UPI00264968C2|nr:galectin-9B-like [Ahaetulla prasina]